MNKELDLIKKFPISRDPPEGGTLREVPQGLVGSIIGFPISRDPPEGGTCRYCSLVDLVQLFPISRDPPEGGTTSVSTA